jgi:amidophosphoribosyltransferase
MSDFLKHECGIAAVRLRKPLAYYYDRYGTCLWGLNKLFLLMEKQHNRGQDGTGIGCVKLNMPMGLPYVHRRRGIEKDALAEIFRKEIKSFYKMSRKGVLNHKEPESVKRHFDFGGSATFVTGRQANSTKAPAIPTSGVPTGPRARSWSWAIST